MSGGHTTGLLQRLDANLPFSPHPQLLPVRYLISIARKRYSSRAAGWTCWWLSPFPFLPLPPSYLLRCTTARAVTVRSSREIEEETSRDVVSTPQLAIR